MRGLTIKEILKRNGFTVSGVAEKLGESNQNLFALLAKDDVRTSLVERISQATGIPVSRFYGDDQNATAIGENASAVSGNNNNVGSPPDRFLDELSAQRKLTEKVLEQNSDLFGIIKNLTATAFPNHGV